MYSRALERHQLKDEPNSESSQDSMTVMQINLEGRVRNLSLPRKQGLRPVFEAIANAIDAIEEKNAQGTVEIRILRDLSQQTMIEGDTGQHPIHGFQITDTGVGFTAKNWQAFQESDTTVKASQGGKGIGRLLYLKAFDRAEIASTFEEDGKWFRRDFNFSLPTGIVDSQLNKVSPSKTTTTVRLIGFNERYRKETPRTGKAIATRIVEHCMERFVLGNCPELTLHDDAAFDLRQHFEEHISILGQPVEFEVNDQRFSLVHVFVSTACGDRHRAYYCAQGRSVFSEPLNLPDLPPSISSSDQQYYYAAYVSGDYLDNNVTPERTGFLGQSEMEPLFAEDISWTELRKEVIERSKEFLGPQIEPVRTAKLKRIQRYIETQAPHYRPLIKHKSEILDDIPPNLKEEDLELALYKHDHEYRTGLKKKGQELIKDLHEGRTDKQGFEERLKQFIQDWNEAGMAELARYVAYRKAILLFLEEGLAQREDGKYSRERVIHEAVFPLRTTSSEVLPEQANLWVIDEKLVYHHYLASDLPFKKMKEVVETESDDRPDLIIFHSASALAESEAPFTSISIVEFKRPERNDYVEAENPVTQLHNYAKTVRDGKAKTAKGRPITVSEGTPFYGYLLCDFTPKLKEMVEAAGMTKTSDGMGYFHYNPNVNMYIQVLSFNKMLQDAKQRNAILFKKLNLPNG